MKQHLKAESSQEVNYQSARLAPFGRVNMLCTPGGLTNAAEYAIYPNRVSNAFKIKGIDLQSRNEIKTLNTIANLQKLSHRR